MLVFFTNYILYVETILGKLGIRYDCSDMEWMTNQVGSLWNVVMALALEKDLNWSEKVT